MVLQKIPYNIDYEDKCCFNIINMPPTYYIIKETKTMFGTEKKVHM